MTASHYAHVSSIWGDLSIQVYSVNRKHYDLNVILPSSLQASEMELREVVNQYVRRGTVTLRITLEENDGVASVVPDLAAIRALHAQYQAIGNEIYEEEKEVPFAFLLEQASRMPHLLDEEEKAKGLDQLKNEIGAVLEKWDDARRVEGKALCADVSGRVETMRGLLHQISSQLEGTEEVYRNELIRRIEAVSTCSSADFDRLAKEVVLYTEKYDVSEEVSRLFSHFDLMQETLTDSEVLKGKRLDFVCIEMQREIHTLNAKAGSFVETALIMQMRGELEKIKEQVLNIL
ncbi:MAG: hypothetical protein S4CHLAM102_09590 [Chlamydiia bacterium]|nr:hypothetical protein [Chlamydiia bacterium]